MPRKTTETGLAAGITRRYRWLRWDEARQRGLNRRVIKKDTPDTNAERAKIYAAQRGMILRMMLPYKTAIARLIHGLYGGRYEMSQGDRVRIEKIHRAINQGELTPEHINTARQIAHKQDVDCGFPTFREVADAQSAARGENTAAQ